jgi:serine/threonine protein kinase
MAEVFAARRTGAEGFAKPVAIKRIASAMSNDPEFARLFIEEARIASMLQHANIVSVLDFDRDDDGALFLAMELIDGTDLRRLILAAHGDGGSMPYDLAAYITAEILRGLDFAHGYAENGRPLGIVHRDVSPHNVLVSRAGEVKLGDFGIAKITAATGAAPSAVSKGKVAYMSPEQARGEMLDGRSDLFAVGVILFEMLAGARPFRAATEPEILARLLTGRFDTLAEVAPHAPAELASVADRLLAFDRRERYGGAAEARQALLAWQGFPTDGASALAALVARVVPKTAPSRSSRSVSSSGAPRSNDSSDPQQLPQAPRTASWRVVAALAVLAALSVTAAVVVWTMPIDEPGRGRAATAAAPVVRSDAGAAPDAGQLAKESAAPDAGQLGRAPSELESEKTRAGDERREPGPATEPKGKRESWKVDRVERSPDLAPRIQ